MPFKKIVKCGALLCIEPNISALIRFDAIVPDTFDILASEIESWRKKLKKIDLTEVQLLLNKKINANLQIEV